MAEGRIGIPPGGTSAQTTVLADCVKPVMSDRLELPMPEADLMVVAALLRPLDGVEVSTTAERVFPRVTAGRFSDWKGDASAGRLRGVLMR
jgi:hypothetical protein